MGIYVVAQVRGDSLTDPEIIVTRDTGTTVIPATAAKEYSRKKPGMKLAVWTLGAYPSQYAVSELGTHVHELARDSVRDYAR